MFDRQLLEFTSNKGPLKECFHGNFVEMSQETRRLQPSTRVPVNCRLLSWINIILIHGTNTEHTQMDTNLATFALGIVDYKAVTCSTKNH